MNMEVSKSIIDDLLKKILPYFFAIVFITTLAGALTGYLEHNAWKIGDWLINYQGGFVRRGLLGEVIYQLAKYTHLTPGIYVFFLQSFLYTVFLYFSFNLLKSQESLLPFALLIFSPYIFTFQINDLAGGFRKEILFFAILAFFVWTTSKKDQKATEKTFYSILVIFPVFILSHEMLAILLPYVLMAYLITTKLTTKKALTIFIFLIPSLISFLAVLNYSGTASQSQDIFNSISAQNYNISGGAISVLRLEADHYTASIHGLILKKNLFCFVVMIALALLAFIPIKNKLKLLAQNRLVLLLFAISIIGTLLLFLIAVDWGRFIYIHLVSIFLISLIPVNSEKPTKQQAPNHSLNILAIIFFLIYVSSWKIPHCCGPSCSFAKNYKQVNVVNFAIPYARVVVHYFPDFKKNFEKWK